MGAESRKLCRASGYVECVECASSCHANACVSLSPSTCTCGSVDSCPKRTLRPPPPCNTSPSNSGPTSNIFLMTPYSLHGAPYSSRPATVPYVSPPHAFYPYHPPIPYAVWPGLQSFSYTSSQGPPPVPRGSQPTAYPGSSAAASRPSSGPSYAVQPARLEPAATSSSAMHSPSGLATSYTAQHRPSCSSSSTTTALPGPESPAAAACPTTSHATSPSVHVPEDVTEL